VGIDWQTVMAGLKERMVRFFEQTNEAWNTTEQYFRMSLEDIINRCKHDEAFKEKVRRVLLSELDDSKE